MIQAYMKWTSSWTKSQLWFLFFVNLWWFIIGLWIAHRFDVARDEAIYWNHQYIQHTTKP